MIILDTNVVSELIAPVVSPAVETWFSAQNGDDLWLTAFSVSELFYGAYRLEPGKRRERLEAAIAGVVFDDFEGRILPFDAVVATRHAELRARLRREGRPTQDGDALIAAIALTHGGAIATRNTRHFADCQVELIDPWSG